MLLTTPLLTLLLLRAAGCYAFQCSTSPNSPQTTEYWICPDEHFNYDDPQNTDDCDHVTTLPVSLCGSDQQTTLALCWRVQDPVSGTVKVSFPLLPQRCNFTGYDLTLMVHEASTCPDHSDDFSKHSKRELVIKNCLEESCRSMCKQRGEAQLRHVFSACYQLYMIPKKNLQAYQELVSSAIMLRTQYVKTPINTTQSPIFNLDWNSASLSMQAKYPWDPAESHLYLSYGIDTSMGHNACRHTGVSLAECVTCLGSPEIQCQSENRDAEAPTCSYQGPSVVKCKFSGLKPGNYCVRIQFDDDRCAIDSVWNNNNNNTYSACTWEVFQQFLSAEQRAVEVMEPVPSSFSRLILIFMAFAIIAVVLIALVVYQHLVPGAPHFLPVRDRALQVAERPVVLLLYTRDCPLFMQAVAQLRTVMRHVYNCQVIDCWEDSQFGTVALSPERWLLFHLTSPHVRIVLVTSPASVVQEAALVHGKAVRYRQPKAFDSLPTYALGKLHEVSSHDSYNRLFIVRLDTGMEGSFPLVRTYLNPLTTYVLPVHLNKLMATFYNLDSTVCTIATDSQADVAILSDIIAKYRVYFKENPRYLDNLMVSEGHQSVLHLLTSQQTPKILSDQ